MGKFPIHYMDSPASQTSMCGWFVYWKSDGTTDTSKVTCGNCKRTKKFKEAGPDEGGTARDTP